MKKILLTCLFTASTVSAATFAQAQESYEEQYGNESFASKWSYIAGAGVAISPEYLGSDEMDTHAIPLLGASYKIDEHQTIKLGFPRTGYSYNTGAYEYGLDLNYDGGRDSSDDRLLTGLEDIDAYATLSPRFAMQMSDLFVFGAQLNLPLSNDVDGYTVDVSVSRTYELTPEISIAWELGTSYANKDYLDSMFSTTANAGVGRAAYTADDAGFYMYSGKTTATYHIDKKNFVLANLGFYKLTGDAGDSSLTQSDTAPQFTMGYVHRF